MQRLWQDAHEPGTLLELLFAQARNLLQLLAVRERSVRLSKFDDLSRERHVETCDLPQQVLAAGVQVDTGEADALAGDVIESATQFDVVAVVLVETHSDVLRVDFDEFCERVLQTPRDRNCSKIIINFKIAESCIALMMYGTLS